MIDKIRVLVVDDSALVREAISAILSSDPSIEVIGTAKNADEAFAKVAALKPDVITMDLNMPGKSGFDAISEIMDAHPTSVIVVSGMNVREIIKALSLGAMDFIMLDRGVEHMGEALIEKIRIASRIKPLRRFMPRPAPLKTVRTEERNRGLIKVVAIGISTGGPQALQVLLSGLPANFPAAIVIVQHITAGFIQGLAEWLGTTSALDVRVAKSGEYLKNSVVYLAPDTNHLKISGDGSVVLSEPVETKAIYVPSIDMMMASAAEVYGPKAIGVIMTGMSRDGVIGIKAIKIAGGTTIAQDEKSSVIFGMNKVAIDSGYVDRIVSLDRMAQELIKLVL